MKLTAWSKNDWAMVPKQKIRLRFTRLGKYYALLTVGIFLAAIVRQVNLLLLLSGLIGAPLFISWYLARRNLRGLRIVRRLPKTLSAGDLLVVEIEAERGGRYGHNWLITVGDTVSRVNRPVPSSAHERLATPQVTFFHLAAGKRTVSFYRGHLSQRGLYFFGPMVVRTRFPLGLFELSFQLPEEQRLLVYPRIGAISHSWMRRSRFHHDGTARWERFSDRVSGDFYGLREWTPGDSPRLVHWRSSARHDQLLVRQFDRPRHRHVVIGLSLVVPSQAVPEDFDRLEKAVRVAATLVHDLCRRGATLISLGICGREMEWLDGSASPGFLQRAMEVLALALPATVDQQCGLWNEVRQRASDGCTLVLIFPRQPGANGGNGHFAPSAGRDQAVPPESPTLSGQEEGFSISGRWSLSIIDVSSDSIDTIYRDLDLATDDLAHSPANVDRQFGPANTASLFGSVNNDGHLVSSNNADSDLRPTHEGDGDRDTGGDGDDGHLAMPSEDLRDLAASHEDRPIVAAGSSTDRPGAGTSRAQEL